MHGKFHGGYVVHYPDIIFKAELLLFTVFTVYS
jgi:hypothetical protein